MTLQKIPIPAIMLIIVGVVGLVAVNFGFVAMRFAAMPNESMMSGDMMNDGMMGHDMMNGDMMGHGMMGNNIVPNVNATPVPTNQPIDREVKIVASNFQFTPSTIVVKKGETIKFTLTNQDGFAHNFGSQDAQIAYMLLPANTTQSVVWQAPQTSGIFTARCTFHPGMQATIQVE